MKLEQLRLTPKRKEICERLDLHDSDEILSYYPFRYEVFERTPYKDLVPGREACIVGELASYPSTFRHGRLSTTRFKVLYEDELITVTIFNRPWIRNLQLNQLMTIKGRYDGQNKLTATAYYAKDMSGEIVPVYPLKEGISQNDIRKLIDSVLSQCKDSLRDDLLPADLAAKHGLIDHLSAIEAIHDPKSRKSLAQALSRLKYEEFLRFYVALDILKQSTSSVNKKKKIFSWEKVNEFIASLGFELTADQAEAVKDILTDLASDKLMYRLIQGEVGSGKTAVAVIALYANALAGYQGALMAPTEILARQHYDNISKMMQPYGIKCAVLYSAMDKEKAVKEAIRNNEVQIIIGTHALFSEDVEYHDLGLVIADEQHRFGVRQRQALKNKGESVDFALMSATPIPRTLAASIYGDMDISTIATLPAGRKGCETILIRKNSMVDIMPQIRETLNRGQQIYIIGSAIDHSDNYNAKDVNGLYEALKEELKPYKVALMHGRLSSDEKETIMQAFNHNDIQVLIATTVVEVGVNVKNATTMVIYDADRFGLSQLHQLRGRVQRGDLKGTCYLLSDSSDEGVLKRLQVLCDTSDGFEISYEDLKLRGPGDILGTRQSGLPAFILGNLIEDTRFIDAAREDAHLISENCKDEKYADYYQEIAKMATKNFIS